MAGTKLLLSTLLAHPDADSRVAIIHESGLETTFSDLDVYARKAAGWLKANGIGQSDKVAIWLVNNTEWLALLFGAARIGATVVAVNTRYRSYEVEHILRDSGAKMLIMQPKFQTIDFLSRVNEINPTNLPELKLVAAVCDEVDTPRTALNCPLTCFNVDGIEPVETDTEADPEQPLILFATSGTTKGPKLVVHNTRSLVIHSRRVAIKESMDEPGARVLAPLPLCGVFSLNAVLGGLAGGAAIILMETFDASGCVVNFARHDGTHVYGSDQMFDLIANAANGENPLPTARRFGFSNFKPELSPFIDRMRAKNFPMIGLYGSSEVQALFSLQKIDAPDSERFAAGGYPVSGNDVVIRARDTSGAILPPNETGEIEIRGQTNFCGYLNDEGEYADVMTEDGFFRTGDIGYTRADGSFVYVERVKDALRLGGFMVSPKEIEAAIKSLDEVADVQVIGIEIGGAMKAAAFIIPVPDQYPRPEVLRQRLRQKVASYKVPDRFWFIDGFPVTEGANGTKIQRSQLRRMANDRILLEDNEEDSV